MHYYSVDIVVNTQNAVKPHTHRNLKKIDIYICMYTSDIY